LHRAPLHHGDVALGGAAATGSAAKPTEPAAAGAEPAAGSAAV